MHGALRLAALALLLASCAAQTGELPKSAEGDAIVLRAGNAMQVWDAKGELVRSFDRASASPDGSVFYTLQGSTLGWVDAKTGRTITEISLPGQYAFANEWGPAPSGFSPNGRWLVLVGAAGATSSFAVVDTGLLKLAAIAEVAGHFTYDAISDDGNSLYLIERITPEAAKSLVAIDPAYAYRVRAYDVPTKKLSDTLVVDVKLAAQTNGDNAETRVDGFMSGIYQSSVPSRDGEWNFSFYYNPKRGPFIHVLHLNARNAFCILDLPVVAGGFERRLGWSLALSASGRTLYAVNGPLGLVSTIDGTSLQVARSATVAGLPAPAEKIESPSSAALSPDGRRLYFAATRGVALVDTRDFSLRGLSLPDHSIVSISLSPDGDRLYALATDGTLWMLDARTGRQLSQIRTQGATALVTVSSRG
jgi:WD40 repeat protein